MSSILIADDNPHARRMGRQVLVEEGYKVWLASDGDEALDQATRHRPDVAIFGTRMEGLSGVELCHLIKTDPKLEQMRIILLAGPRETLEPHVKSSPPSDGMLRKPLDSNSVLKMVRSLLDQKILPGKGSNGDAVLDQALQNRPDLAIFGMLATEVISSATEAHSEKEDADKGSNGDAVLDQALQNRPDLAIFGTLATKVISSATEAHSEKEDADVSVYSPPTETGNNATAQTVVSGNDSSGGIIQTTTLKNIPAVDAADLRVAVTAAVEAAVPRIVDHITEQILKTIRKR